MNIPSVDIRDMLVADSSINLVFGTNLFIGQLPKLPNNCVSIVDTSGFADDITLSGQDETYCRPSVQIQVRNDSYDSAMTLGQNIKNLLNGRHGETWNSTFYSLIRCTSGPALLEWDDKDNCKVFLNFDLQRR